MIEFLDFIFPFGNQEYARDFFYSGFQEDTRLSSPHIGLAVPELGRSGREIRLCYNLKSVEASTTTPNWPWSIRQTSVYHSFDIETGKAFWIMVKGNDSIKTRIQKAVETGFKRPPYLKSFESTSEAFASTLATYLVLCDWCIENWRLYLNYIDQRMQDTTTLDMATIGDKEVHIYEQSIHGIPGEVTGNDDVEDDGFSLEKLHDLQYLEKRGFTRSRSQYLRSYGTERSHSICHLFERFSG
jgi:hypothetical protein